MGNSILWEIWFYSSHKKASHSIT